jgi:superfamily II DNA or RNA helicase
MQMFVAERKRVLFLVDRRELINQTSVKLLQAGIDHAVIMGKDRRENAGKHVQLASIQTISRRMLPPADYVIIDEAHHCNSSIYLKVLTKYPLATKIGFTATPQRLDGRSLSHNFSKLIEVATISELILNGYLMKPIVYGFEQPQLDSVAIKDGDYETNSLVEVIDKPQLIGNLVNNWRKYADGMKSIAYGANIAHSQHIAQIFNAAGVKACCVSS